MTHTHTHVIHVCVRACAGARACARACVFVFVCVCVCVCVYACESPGASATIRPTASCPRAPRSASAAARSHCRHTVAAVGSSLHVPPHVPRPIRGAPGQVPLRAAAVGLRVAAAPNPTRLARTRWTLHPVFLFQLLRFRAHTHARTRTRTCARTHARTHARTRTHTHTLASEPPDTSESRGAPSAHPGSAGAPAARGRRSESLPPPPTGRRRPRRDWCRRGYGTRGRIAYCRLQRTGVYCKRPGVAGRHFGRRGRRTDAKGALPKGGHPDAPKVTRTDSE